MAVRRSEQIDPENGGYYHLISRCVRRAFLCGEDPETHINYDYRRQWIENRIIELAEIFSVEVYAYSVMHNHYHLVIYSDPRAPQKWSDNEVAERWLKVFPGKLDQPGYTSQRANKIQMILKDPQLLATYRERLGSVSWLMRRINEPLAKMANAEDFCKGHFWDHFLRPAPTVGALGENGIHYIRVNKSRFKSQALLDVGGALSCMAYVDLNPIRACIAQSIGESKHTGIKKRLEEIDDSSLNQTLKSIAGNVKSRTMVLPLKDYIELVEWTGSAICYPGKKKLPSHLVGTLNHLNIRQDNWLVNVQCYGSRYYRFVGSLNNLKEKCHQLKQKWLKGSKPVDSLYLN